MLVGFLEVMALKEEDLPKSFSPWNVVGSGGPGNDLRGQVGVETQGA